MDLYRFGLLFWLQIRPVSRTSLYRAFSSQGDVFTIVVPSMGDSITEGTVANWVKSA